MPKLALAWAIKNPNVTTVLLGATKVAQLEENLGAVEVARELTDEHMEAIGKILDNAPEAWSGYGGAGMRAALPKILERATDENPDVRTAAAVAPRLTRASACWRDTPAPSRV